MMQPPGFEVEEPIGSTSVCPILRSLYGFKQSGRIWNQTFHNFLTKFEMESTETDPYVYISKTKPHLILTLFVDNGLACCASQAKLDALILHME
jgi:hypothetical protein